MTKEIKDPKHLDKTEDYRKQFLLRMYDQMLNDINTHILVVWQSVGVLIGAFAIFALVEKRVIPIDFAGAIFILIATWLIAHLYDASYWYNRNLAIIANIERQFLKHDDLFNIHYYFGKHRKTNAMLKHLRIQWFFGFILTILILLYHFLNRCLPLFTKSDAKFELQMVIPYLVLIVCIILLGLIRNNRIKAYKEFLKNAPGIEIDTDGIDYGIGHPIEK